PDRRLRPRRLREAVLEADAARRELLEERRGPPRVAVRAQVVRAAGVDQVEEDAPPLRTRRLRNGRRFLRNRPQTRRERDDRPPDPPAARPREPVASVSAPRRREHPPPASGSLDTRSPRRPSFPPPTPP